VAVRRSYLRHVRPADYSYLFGLLVDGPNGARWRFGGATPSPDAFERNLWSGVAAQFVAETPAGRAGHAALFNVVLEAGRGEVALAVGPEHQGRGTLTAGIGLALLHHGFTNWPLARVHARVPGYNIGRLGRLFATGWVEEGRFTDHHFAGGRLWDEHVLVLTRADWEKVEDRYGRFRLPVRPPDDDEVPG
jgi:RimJ/RimL family protein N-acetyltransferase